MIAGVQRQTGSERTGGRQSERSSGDHKWDNSCDNECSRRAREWQLLLMYWRPNIARSYKRALVASMHQVDDTLRRPLLAGL